MAELTLRPTTLVMNFLSKHSDNCPCGSNDLFGNCCGLNPNSIPKGVVIKKAAITENKCNSMVQYLANRNKTWLGTTTNSTGSFTEPSINETRITQSIDQGKLKKIIRNIVEKELIGFAKDHLNEEIAWYEDPAVLYYESGGKYEIHADSENLNQMLNEWIKFIDRDYSLLIYLSDQFDGGELTFCRFGFTYKPSKGDVILFPSDNRYIHQANEVKAGKRFAIVSWCSLKSTTKTFTPPRSAVFTS